MGKNADILAACGYVPAPPQLTITHPSTTTTPDEYSEPMPSSTKSTHSVDKCTNTLKYFINVFEICVPSPELVQMGKDVYLKLLKQNVSLM